MGLLGEAQIASDHVGDRFGFGDLANAAGGDRQGGVVVVPRRARNAGSGSMRRRRGEGGVGEARGVAPVVLFSGNGPVRRQCRSGGRGAGEGRRAGLGGGGGL